MIPNPDINIPGAYLLAEISGDPAVVTFRPDIPVALEKKPFADSAVRDRFPAGTQFLVKDDARKVEPPVYIAATDIILIVCREGQPEPSIALIHRKPDAPGGERYSLPGGCCPLSGPIEGAMVALNTDFAIEGPGSGRLSMKEALDVYRAVDVDDILHPVTLRYEPLDGKSTEQALFCRPFKHRDVQNLEGDGAVYNLSQAKVVKLPPDAHIVDASPHGREIVEIPLSQLKRFLENEARKGVGTLPAVRFAVDVLLPELLASPAIKRVMQGELPSAAPSRTASLA